MPTLDWLNRASAFTTAARVPYRLLEQVSVHTPTAPSLPARPDPASVRPELVEGSAASTSSARTGITDNLLIQGDNLEALKALLPFYRGQVKCIFVDLPQTPARCKQVRATECAGGTMRLALDFKALQNRH